MMLSKPDWSSDILEKSGVTEANIQKLGKELDDYLAIYEDCYSRKDTREHGELFVKGLLSDLERKSIEPIALRYGGENEVRCMQIFFKNSPRDDQKMLNTYQEQLSYTIGDPEGMINTDGSDFAKKGSNSVGVKRQYCGSLGKTENCQAGVFVGYSSPKGYVVNYICLKTGLMMSIRNLEKNVQFPRTLSSRTKL